MPEFGLTWSFGSKSAMYYIAENMVIGKYSFDASKFDEAKYLQEKKESDGKGERITHTNRIYISWGMVSSDGVNLEKESEKELDILMQFLTTQTNRIFEHGGISYRQYDEEGKLSPATVSFVSTITRNPSPEELNKNVLGRCVDLKQKFDSLKEEKKFFLRRSLEWYHRGTREGDKTNSYANYWIGFESLSSVFSKGPPRKCPKCDTQIDSESISKRMQEFLTKLGYANRWKDEVKDLYDVRNSLFHRSETDFDRQNIVKLRDLLRDCLVTYLDQFGT